MHAYSKQENKQMSQRTVYRMIKRVEQQIKNHKVSNFKDFQENLRIERIKNISRSFKLEEIQNFKNYLEKSTFNRKSLYNKFKNMMSDLQKQFPELIQNINQKTNLKFFQYQFKDYYKKINRGLPKTNCLDNEKQNQIYKIKQEDQSTNTSCQFINQSQNKNSNNNFNFNSDNFGSDCQKNYNQIKIEEQINQIEKYLNTLGVFIK
ncbi:hypothetical protein PPERSA_02093 [Pseudocohnilembus persalinus]|uniref:Uncharacterized protein n=1 Tax=Pseudocohnilembus persalinus TaxID=266149 RepID=A0A0V0Q7V4_PSEPJ|nr:hypothetical protein PPERSA_02093 [Pseudocohnilembus persalinus]|eukprot:KRW98316.1 hypothetical protein PPERSA_02093 [Pseudocohnilembus persalinus]